MNLFIFVAYETLIFEFIKNYPMDLEIIYQEKK